MGEGNSDRRARNPIYRPGGRSGSNWGSLRIWMCDCGLFRGLGIVPAALGERKLHGESCAFANPIAGRAEAAIVGVDERLADRQPQAKAAELAGDGG